MNRHGAGEVGREDGGERAGDKAEGREPEHPPHAHGIEQGTANGDGDREPQEWHPQDPSHHIGGVQRINEIEENGLQVVADAGADAGRNAGGHERDHTEDEQLCPVIFFNAGRRILRVHGGVRDSGA